MAAIVPFLLELQTIPWKKPMWNWVIRTDTKFQSSRVRRFRATANLSIFAPFSYMLSTWENTKNLITGEVTGRFSCNFNSIIHSQRYTRDLSFRAIWLLTPPLESEHTFLGLELQLVARGLWLIEPRLAKYPVCCSNGFFLWRISINCSSVSQIDWEVWLLERGQTKTTVNGSTYRSRGLGS